MAPLIQHDDSASGDQTYGDVAGRDVIKLQIGDIQEVQLRLIDVLQRQSDALTGRLDVLQHQSDALTSRLAALEREWRQAEQDAAMERGIGMEARIKQQFAILAELAAHRRSINLLALVVIVALAAICLLLADRYILGAVARLWFDALPVLARIFR